MQAWGVIACSSVNADVLRHDHEPKRSLQIFTNSLRIFISRIHSMGTIVLALLALRD
jgi:hypothetical protein